MSNEPPILIVDDNADDLEAMQELVRKAKLSNPMELFRNGDDVIEFLKAWCHEAPTNCSRAALLLLDVRMPKVSGFDVLAWVRRHPLLHGLVVVMISHFEESGDAERAVQMGAHTYLHKYPHPQTLAALVKLASSSKVET